MLNLSNINFAISPETSTKQIILDQLSLYVKPLEFVTIIGNNGAGKSTLINVISGLITPASGNIKINNQDLPQDYRLRSQLIAKVMQDPKLGTVENMTIYENLSFALKRGQRRMLTSYFNINRVKFFQAKLKMLNMGLENRLDEFVRNLSGGQRQAISLIMAILTDAKILLLDEICAALDPVSSENIMQLASKIIRLEQRTCLMITHNMTHALKYSDRILLLGKGQILKEFTAFEIAILTPQHLTNELENLN